jgi:hypothetical protein
MSDNYLNIYNKLIKKMDGQSQDTESYHIEQDAIYRKFIKDIATDKINNLEEIVTLSKLLNKKVVKNDKGMWYS